MSLPSILLHMLVRGARRHAVLAVCALAPLGAAAQPVGADGPPLWMRHPAISPDGTQIAFSYRGQIWRVAAAGGEAVPLTSGEFYSTRPVWSPDSKHLAFASKRHGNLDVYRMPAAGGPVQRLTFHSADDRPSAFSPDGRTVYFASARLGSPNSVHAGTYQGSDQLYTVPADGGRERLLIPTPALDVDASPDGRHLIYDDRPTYENDWRKGAVSDAAHDLWLYDIAAGTHRKLSSYRGEDRDAAFSADGRSYVYLSGRSGTLNVWRAALDGSMAEVQLTTHSGDAVRFPTLARDGTLVYGFGGEIWRRTPGEGAAARVPVHVSQASLTQGGSVADVNEYASELAVSPDGNQVAVIARGEVFVMAMASGRTRRITSTPEHERGVAFSPDGRSLVYSSARDGDEDLYEARHGVPGAVSFLDAGPIVERKIVDTEGDALQPAYSPDGSRIAFIANRESLQVYDRLTGRTTVAMPPGSIYSYQDGDLSFAWSPDGRWLTTTRGSIVSATDVVLVDAAGRQPPINLSSSGHTDQAPQFSADGRAVYWLTSRYGLKTADANVAEFDVQIAFLTPEAHDAFRAAREGTTPGAALGVAPAPGGGATSTGWQPQVAGLALRSARLTPFSVVPAYVRLAADNGSLFVIGVEAPGRVAGYLFDLRRGGMRQLFVKPLDAGAFATDASGRMLYALGPAGIEVMDLSSGESATRPLVAEMSYDPRGEMRWLFERFWRMTKLKFYNPDMHGVDWAAQRVQYLRYLPHIDAWEDFADLLGEMAGQLNASHMGGYYQPPPSGDRTASLGLHEDPAHEGPGIKVAAVLPGGPADRTGSALAAGAVVLAVDGRAIGPREGLDALLDHKAGVPVQVTVQPAGGGAPVQETLTPIDQGRAMALATERWVAERRAMTERLSGGRIGYLYIEKMALEDYQRAYGELFGPLREKDAVVIDIRFNRGGNLHDQLIAMFTGEVFAGFTTRDGRLVGRMPINRWAKPSALLANAGSYSDGSIFPHLYQRQRIGPVIGTRVPGTGTAVWWMEEIDGRIKYGIPQLGARDFKTGWFENSETVPDELVVNDPGAVAAGRDPQLEAAVKRLMGGVSR